MDNNFLLDDIIELINSPISNFDITQCSISDDVMEEVCIYFKEELSKQSNTKGSSYYA